MGARIGAGPFGSREPVAASGGGNLPRPRTSPPATATHLTPGESPCVTHRPSGRAAHRPHHRARASARALAVPAQAAAPTVDLQPQELSRGADIAVPHIEDGDFVDGDRRIELPGHRSPEVIGRVRRRLAGRTTNNRVGNRNRRVVRVEPDGTVVDVLRDVDPRPCILSARTAAPSAWQASVSEGRR